MDTARLPRILGAIIYDLIIVLAIIFIAAQWFPLVPAQVQDHPLINSLKQVYILGIAFLYFAYSWRRGGQTIGMKSWRIRLYQADTMDKQISWRQCLVRYLTAVVSWLAASVGFLWIIFDREHRSWHDITSATRLRVIPREKKN